MTSEYRLIKGGGAGSKAIVILAGILLMFLPGVSQAGQATVDNGDIDLVINYHGSPAGNDDGNATETPRSAQDVIEGIIGHYADAVYEATETAHRLRKVRIYKNGQVPQGVNADIVWLSTLPGGAGPSSGPVANDHINMCDTWVNDNNWSALTDEMGAGYTLGHEMGHFMYGLYDEYDLGDAWEQQIFGNSFQDTPVSPSIMNRQWNARDPANPNFHDYKWLNFSIAANSTPGFQDYEDTLQTEQHRSMGASCWETLARATSADPATFARAWSLNGHRRHYAGLVAPAAGAAPQINLGVVGADPRRDLNIVWMTTNLVCQLVLDRSGSMAGSKLADVKAAAKLLLGEMKLDKTSVGIIEFDDVVTVLRPITKITSENVRNDLIAAVDSITDRNATAVGDAAKRALDDIVAFGTRGDSKFVFLLTDGLSNSGRDPLTVIPEYKAHDVRLYTFGFGSDADQAMLSQMAVGTSGEYRFSPTSLVDLHEAFKDAYGSASSGVKLSAKSSPVAQGTVQTSKFYVDASLVSLSVSILFDNGALTSSLSDPSGAAILPTQSIQQSGKTMVIFEVQNPVQGDWQLVLNATGTAGGDVATDITGETAGISYTLEAVSVSGSTLAYPMPLVIQALLHSGAHIAGASVQAEVIEPDGTAIVVPLHDDGVYPDQISGDGLYYATFTYRQDGAHRVTVTANNSAGTAAFTSTGRMLSQPPSGNGGGVSTNVPIASNFQRVSTFQVQASGAPRFINVTPYSSTDFASWQLDRASGAMVGSMVVSNYPTSFKTLSTPFWYGLMQSQDIKLANPSGVTNGMPYIDITAKVNAALQAKYGRLTMQPSEWVVIDGIQIYSRDLSRPQVSALWALFADPPGGTMRNLDAYDFDKDGLIGDSEILKAVHDWSANDMNDFDLLRRIQAWKEGPHPVGGQ